jgi:hypothetical protein
MTTLRSVPLLTNAAEDASRVAHTDRTAAADLVLSLAVTDAIDLIREGRVGFAEYRLERALISAGRILGKEGQR